MTSKAGQQSCGVMIVALLFSSAVELLELEDEVLLGESDSDDDGDDDDDESEPSPVPPTFDASTVSWLESSEVTTGSVMPFRPANPILLLS